MTFSLNEIETMGKRAARGAGLAWGLAEEAGKAARWLTARGLPGAEELGEVLTRHDGVAYDDIAPAIADGVWAAPSGRLCPLVAGPALCDRASYLAAGEEIALGATAQPLLLVPYLAGAARLTGADFEISWAGVTVVVAADGFAFDGARAALTARCAPGVHCRRADGNVTQADIVETNAAAVDAEAWRRLEAFAQRTYAPATETSRLMGAGAGLIDSD
jgi:hypothetical protein